MLPIDRTQSGVSYLIDSISEHPLESLVTVMALAVITLVCLLIKDTLNRINRLDAEVAQLEIQSTQLHTHVEALGRATDDLVETHRMRDLDALFEGVD